MCPESLLLLGGFRGIRSCISLLRLGHAKRPEVLRQPPIESGLSPVTVAAQPAEVPLGERPPEREGPSALATLISSLWSSSSEAPPPPSHIVTCSCEGFWPGGDTVASRQYRC